MSCRATRRSPPRREYGAALRAAGFHPIPEIQPSRHRLSLPLVPGTDDDTVRAGLSKSTRQRIAAAEGSDLRVARYDTAGAPSDDPGLDGPARPLDEALDRFYGLLEATGDRRHFRFGPRSAFVPWWRLAHDRRAPRLPGSERRRRRGRGARPVPARPAVDHGPFRRRTGRP